MLCVHAVLHRLLPLLLLLLLLQLLLCKRSWGLCGDGRQRGSVICRVQLLQRVSAQHE
jgi:hypothetical protein